MGLIRINRKGKAITDQCGSNQCKHTGHSHYGYQVSIASHEANLDNNGWIIDNRVIPDIIDSIFKEYGFESCEAIVCRIARQVESAAIKSGVMVYDVYVKLWPRKENDLETLDLEDFAWFEYSTHGSFVD